MLALSFNIVQELRNVYPEKKFFVLYDCLKQSCCLDVIGAEHVAYDCLIHFGEACFSEPYLPNQYYLFDSLSHEHRKNLEILLSGKIVEYLHSRNIGYVMAEQKCYEEVK